MSSDQKREEVILFWWSEAWQSLASAKRELEANAYRSAVNRLYYAAFYAVSAVLLDRRATFKKHSGVQAAFHRIVIKPGLLDEQWGAFYNQLFNDRQAADYIAFTTFTRPYVEEQLQKSEEFLKVLHSLLSVLGPEG